MTTTPANIFIKGGEEIPAHPKAEVTLEATAENAAETKVEDEQKNNEVSETKIEETKISEETKEVEEKSTEPKVEIKVTELEPKKPTKAELLKEYGLDEDELADLQKVKAEKNKPDEEQMEFSKLLEYAATTKKATKAEIIEFETIQKSDNATLVYDKFAADEKKKDNTLTDEAIRELFNAEYFIGDENKKLEKQGLKMLADEANEIRQPVIDKIESVKKEYIAHSNLGAFQKQQITAVEEFNKHEITKTVEINGKKIEVSVKPDMSFDELKKYFSTDEGKEINNYLFNAFIQNPAQSDQLLGKILAERTAQIKEPEALQALANTIWAQAEAHFKDKSPGAKAPFESKKESILANAPEGVDETAQYIAYKKRTS